MSALEENETLEELDFQDNTFGGQGLYGALASSLPEFQGLRRLFVDDIRSFGHVGDAGEEGFERILTRPQYFRG
jgi:Ran GTPase-activating protein (RanGAP) involved in mRNA processing and transport